MPTTTRLQLVTPAGTDPNDFAAAMAALAEGIDDSAAGYGQGARADRPAAGVAGRFYMATDNTVEGGLFYDTGSTWIRVTPSPWETWTPTKTLIDGGGNVIGNVTYIENDSGGATFRYRTLPGLTIEIYVYGNIRFTGTQRRFGIQYSLPVAPSARTPVASDAMNDIGRAVVIPGDPAALQIYPYGAYNPTGTAGQWLVDNTPRSLTVTGAYRV